MTNKVTLPTSIQQDLSLLFSNYSTKTTSLRTAINILHDNPKVYPNLFIWLFDTVNFKMNQVKFAIYLGGSDYDFIDNQYNYFTKKGRIIGTTYKLKSILLE